MTKISLYKNSTDTTGVEVGYLKILAGIQSGRWQKDIQNLRTLLESEGVDRYSQSKKSLPAATFGGTFTERNAASIKQHSQMIILDVDGITKSQIESYKNSFKDDKFIHSCFISPSDRGLKILVRLNAGHEYHLHAFLALKEYFKQSYALSIDDSGKDVSRLCFISYDEKMYLNEESEPFTFKIEDIKTGPTASKFDERPEKFKGYIISKDAKYAFGVCEKWTQRHHQYEQGNRNNYIHVLSCNLNRAGVDINDAMLMVYNNHSDLPFKEIETTVRSAYRRQSEHNTIDIYNTDEANLPDHTEDLGLTNEQEIIFNDTLKLKKLGADNNMIAKLIKNFGIAFFGMTEKEVGEVMNKAVLAFKSDSIKDNLSHKSIDDSILSILDDYVDSGGVPTTISEFDEDLQGGLMPGQLYGLIGKGKTFKSIFAHWLAAENARNGGLSLYLNGEMSRLQLLDRALNKELGINLISGLRDKTINESTLPDIAKQLKEKLNGNFEVVDGSGWTEESLLKTVKEIEYKTKKKVALIIVDGLSQCEDTKKDEIKSAIYNSGMLKEVAKKTNTAIAVLVHVSGGIVSHLRDTSKHVRGGDKILNNMDAMFCTSLLIDEEASDIPNGDIIYRKGKFYLRYIDKRSSGNVISKIIDVKHPMKLIPLDIEPGALEVDTKI